MKQKPTLIFDGQILQSPALERGMGQYVTALLTALNGFAKQGGVDVRLVISNMQPANNLLQKLLQSWSNIEVVKLPLVGAEEIKNTERALNHNRDVLDNWVEKESLAGAPYIIGSLFQAEVFPAFPTKAYKLTIAYDAIPIQFFKDYQPKMRWHDYLTRFSLLHEANKVLCISKTTANDMQIYCSVPPHKIAVINGGPGALGKPKGPKHKPKNPFILMPTGNDIRKNNRAGISGFEHFRLSHPHDLSLIVTSYFSEKEKEDLQKLSPNVIFTGSVSNSELAWYYQTCKALLFPSLYEGLGMPIIEAMLFNKPVVASGIDVFTEISKDLPYYFNPSDPLSIANALGKALTATDFSSRQIRYDEVTKAYTWEKTAQGLLNVTNEVSSDKPEQHNPRIAIIGPYSFGVSAIGKFMTSLHPTLQEIYGIEYFFEPSPIDKELRPDILSHVVACQNIRALTDKKIQEYDTVIYHVGNSNHHTVTVSRALLKPGIVILHDLNIENVYKDLVARKMIDEGRFKLEEELNKNSGAGFLYSLVSRQRGVIVHSLYAKKVIEKLLGKDNNVPVIHAQLSVDTPKYYEHPPQGQFTIGLAGILANIKGLEAIEQIARDEDFKYDKILLFGLNFAEKGVLEELRQLPNIEIATDLSDYEFQQNLKRMSIFINYRTAYQGEASYSTLEAMRYGIPVFVRSDFGWYSELPDNAVVKVANQNEIIPKIRHLKLNQALLLKIGLNAANVTATMHAHEQYAAAIVELYQMMKERQS